MKIRIFSKPLKTVIKMPEMMSFVAKFFNELSSFNSSQNHCYDLKFSIFTVD